MLSEPGVGKPMATIDVRRLDEEVVKRPKERAAANRRSLEAEVRHLLEGVAGDGASVVTLQDCATGR